MELKTISAGFGVQAFFYWILKEVTEKKQHFLSCIFRKYRRAPLQTVNEEEEFGKPRKPPTGKVSKRYAYSNPPIYKFY